MLLSFTAVALLINVGCFYFEFSKSINPREPLSNRHENKQLATCVHGGWWWWWLLDGRYWLLVYGGVMIKKDY